MQDNDRLIFTLIGTGTGVPHSDRNPPCLLMRFGERKAIFDSGPGTLQKLLKFKINCLNIDYLFYTHLHLDHVYELSTILFAAKIPPSIRKKVLYVYGPSGLKAFYDKLKDLFKETICTDAYTLKIEEIENKTIDIDSINISTKTLEHHGGNMGYRIVTPKGKIVIYTGDTDYCEGAVELSKDADLLITECAFPDELKMKGHLTPITAGKLAKEASAKKMVFVHMYPVCDQYDLIRACGKEFNGEVIAGKDGMEFEF